MHKASLLRVAPFALVVLVAGTGCTTLGPVPGMTAVNAVPVHGADVEAQVAAVPGYYLSSAVQQDDAGTVLEQGSALFEPNELIHVQGLSAGARYVSGDNDGYFEPMLRYRHWLGRDQRVAFAVVGYGTHASGSDKAASYSMTHAGGELGFDVRATPTSPWAELHLQGGAAVSGLFASGDYCRSLETGLGVDCGDNQRANTHAQVSGAYPSFYVGSSVDFARHLPLFIHDARFALFIGAGWMPEIQYGESTQRRGWASAGGSITLALGTAGKSAK